MKSLLAILALAVVASAGYWKFRNPDAGIADLGNQASAQASQLTSALSFGAADTSKLEAQLASSQSQWEETSSALDSNQQVLEQALQRIAELETQVGATEEALQSASKDFANSESALDERLNTITNKVDQRLAGTASQMEPIQNRLADLETSLNEMDAGFSNTTSAITKRLQTELATQISERESAAAQATEAVSNRIDKLEKQVADVASKAEAGATASQLDELEQQIGQLQAGIQASEESLGDRLDTALDGRIASLSESIEQKRKIDSDNNTRLLRQSVNRMDNRIKAISAASGEADAALELSSALDDRIDDVENSIAEIEKNPAIQRMERRLLEQVEKTNTSITTLQDSVLAEAAANTETLSQKLESSQQKIAAMEATMASLDKENSASNEAMIERYSELGERLDTLESAEIQLAAALPQIQAVERNSFTAAKGAELSRKLDDLDSRLISLKNVVEETPQGSHSTEDSIALSTGLKSEVTRISQRIEEIDAQLAAMADRPSANNTDQVKTELEAKLAELEKRLAQQVQQPDDRLANEVDQLNKKLGLLEQERLAAANTAQLGKPNEYKIYFGKDSVSISDDAEIVLKSFISQEQNRASSVSIFGFTDRSGNAAYNQRLALRRANGVRSYLIQQGFDFRKINAVDGLGEDPAASKLDDGQEDANQRTVVLYAYQK